MHDKDGTVKGGRVFVNLLLHKIEVRHGRHIIILSGIGVETNELDASCYEREIQTISKRRPPYLVTGTKEIMIANKHNIRLIEFLQNIVAPFKLTGGTRIREVTAMNDEVDAVVGIDRRYLILKLRMPQVRVADKRHTQRVAILEPLLNNRDIRRVEILPAFIIGIVRVHVKQPLVATGKEQHDA